MGGRDCYGGCRDSGLSERDFGGAGIVITGGDTAPSRMNFETVDQEEEEVRKIW